MGLLDIFKSDKDGVRRSHIKNLISVAMADGHLDQGEWDLLLAIARYLGMTEDEIVSIKENPDKIKFIPPKRYEDKVQQIQDLVAVMTIDGHVNNGELELCKKISLLLDILPQMVDDILSGMVPSSAVSKGSAQS